MEYRRYAELTESAIANGRAHAEDLLSVWEVPTGADAEALLQMILENDPEVWDHIPTVDLSGQWCQGWTVGMVADVIGMELHEIGTDGDCDDLMALVDVWEDAATERLSGSATLILWRQVLPGMLQDVSRAYRQRKLDLHHMICEAYPRMTQTEIASAVMLSQQRISQILGNDQGVSVSEARPTGDALEAMSHTM